MLDIGQYRSIKSKAVGIHAMKTRIFYDPTRLKRVPVTSTFVGIVSNHNLVIHSIASLSMQRANISKEPIRCTFTTLQNL